MPSAFAEVLCNLRPPWDYKAQHSSFLVVHADFSLGKFGHFLPNPQNIAPSYRRSRLLRQCFTVIDIPVGLFQILKDDAVKMLYSICQQIWKTQQWPQNWKRSVFIPIPKKGNAKGCSNYCTIALISHASKVMLKFLQARLQQYVNCELPDVQAGLEKAEEPEIKLLTSTGSWKKQESSRKTSISALTMPKPLTVWITINCGKLWKRWEYETT